jgi:hypothetical protein
MSRITMNVGAPDTSPTIQDEFSVPLRRPNLPAKSPFLEVFLDKAAMFWWLSRGAVRSGISWRSACQV